MSNDALVPATGDQPDDGSGRRVLVVVDPQVAVGVGVALLATFALFAVARDASATLTRVGMGVILALALDGVVRKLMARFGWARPRAVAVVAAGLFAVAALVVLVLGPPAVEQAQDFATSLPETVEDLYTVPLVGNWLESADAATTVEEFVAELPATVSTDTITDLAQTLVGGVVAVLMVVVTTLTVLLDGERLVGLVRRAIPAARRDRADLVGRVFYRVVGRYFGGSLTVAAMMGLYVLTIALVFGVPLAPLVAVWAMVTDLIPQIGGFLGGAFLAIVALAAGPGTAIVVVVLYVLYMNLENHVIQPAIIGAAVDLSPPTTMIAALVGAAAGGVPGALVATPLVGAVKQLYFEIHDPGRIPHDEPSGLGAKLASLRHRHASS
jgi:predicted PurR-regulated permease PerM